MPSNENNLKPDHLAVQPKESFLILTPVNQITPRSRQTETFLDISIEQLGLAIDQLLAIAKIQSES
jgi:hypothetical protein